ncbi:hypothetical protein ABLT93_03885 [Acinetobacter soli]|uniref:hypothetical protein n=1 Tax=Acinetobacter soli TaxID=487316 RepID=UPI002D7EB9BC|nr:hypothetical protein [Acinetobacter soli]MEB4800096.1 hypothetical protein [Acinetobacter soli]
MKKYLNLSIVSFCIILVACGNESDQQVVYDENHKKQDESYDILDQKNYVTAYKYQERYDSIVQDCGANDKPSYECSGIIFRGIRSSAQAKPWIHRKKDKDKGVLSFAYIRQDQNFKLPSHTYQSGVIIRPDFEKNIKIKCASPMDMNTDYRGIAPTYNHCLASTENKYSSIDYTVKDCQDWGIDTAQKWLDVFIPVMKNTIKQRGNLYQIPGQTCSFNMSINDLDKIKDRAKYFNMFAEIRKNIPLEFRTEWWNNEMLVTIWDDNQVTNAPIEAFYYNFGDQKGLNDAQNFQKNYFNDTGTILPIIAVEFQVDTASKFFYSQHDQLILSELKKSDIEKAKIAAEWLTSSPPTQSSNIFLQDKKQYESLLSIDSLRWNLAISDSNIDTEYLLKRFSKDVNPMLENNKVKGLLDYITAFEQPVANGIKTQYMRKRPFQYYQVSTCTPSDEPMLEKNGSYPSGHSLRGYLVAAALSDLDTQHQIQLQKIGQDYALSRMVCRAHWESDTYAAEKISLIVMNVLKDSPDYLNKIKEAKSAIQ